MKKHLNNTQLTTYNHLISMGFNPKLSITSSVKYGRDINSAIQYIFDHSAKTEDETLTPPFNIFQIIPLKPWIIKVDHNFTVTLYPNDTIGDLKHKLKTLIKMPPYKQCKAVIFRRQLIADDCLNVYDVCVKYDIYKLFSQVDFKFKTSIKPQYLHRHHPDESNCPEIKQHNKCRVYERLLHYKYCEADLHHMEMHTHYTLKPTNCKYGVECRAYKRLVKGGHRLDDRCHLHVFNHPPRGSQSKISIPSDFHPFIFSEHPSDHIQKGNVDCDAKEDDRPWLERLIDEMKKNGFGSDLICPDRTYASLMKIVTEKLKHPRHVAMCSPLNEAQMLALVLYTGCKCNYDLCKSQRNGDYKKWKVFHICLSSAVDILSQFEAYPFPVFSGVGGVMMDFSAETKHGDHGKNRKFGYLVTYMSTSWDKYVAQMFLDSTGGMLVGIESGMMGSRSCCDVTWISKFPNEKEVLFRPFGGYFYAHFVKQSNEYQYVQMNCASDADEKLF